MEVATFCYYSRDWVKLSPHKTDGVPVDLHMVVPPIPDKFDRFHQSSTVCTSASFLNCSTTYPLEDITVA